MRTLHFIQSFPELSETFIRRFVDKSNQFGESAVVCFQKKDEFKEAKVFELPAEFHIRRKPKGLLKFTIEKFLGETYWNKAFKKIIREFRPDVVHCHFGPMGIKFLSCGIKIPFVTSFYGYDIGALPLVNKAYASLLPELFKVGQGFLVEGPVLGKRLIQLGAPEGKVFLNPLLIPLNEYPRKESYRRSYESAKFIFVGRFVEKKGFHLFLEAIGSIKDNLPQFNIDVVGFGELEDLYKSIAEKYKFSNNIKFLGKKKHTEVLEMLRQYDFFVHPSFTAQNGDSEGGAPAIISEAQAVGVPIIASDHADIPFVMGYANFLCQEGNVEELQENICKAVRFRDWPFLIEEGRNKVKNQHDLNSSEYYFKALSAVVGD